MATKVGTAVYEIGADLAPLDKGLAQAERAAEQSARKMSEAAEREAKKAADAVEKQAQALNKSLDRLSIIGVAGFAALGGASIKAGIDFESSFAGVRKTVDATEQEFTQLQNSFRDMAKQIPVNVNEINRIGEAAGQLGIKKENIVAFTRVMADLGVATNLSSDEAATALARLANITQMPQTEFDRLGSTVVALGNNFATTEAEIVAMGLRLAGAGSQIGLTEAQILSFATALSSVGIEAEAGGSAFSRVMVEIASQVETSGDKLETFARVAGMSAEEFSAAWREDAASALVAFVTGLANMESTGQSTLGVLEELEITEVRMRDALLRASGAGDLLTRSLQIGADAWKENNALTKEAEQRYETTASQIQIMRNQFNDAAISLGNDLLPAVQGAVRVFSGFADAIDEVPDSTRNVALGIGAIMTALPLATTAAGKAMEAFRALQTSWQTAGAEATIFRTKLGLLAGAGGIGALVIGVDLLTQALAGKSIFDILFGGGGGEARAERVAKALEAYNNEIRYLTPGTERAEVRVRKLGEATDTLTQALMDSNFMGSEFNQRLQDGEVSAVELDAAFQKLLGTADVGNKLGTEFKGTWEQVSATVSAMGQAARDSDIPLSQLVLEANNLPPALRQIFLEGAGATEALAQMNSAADGSTRHWGEFNTMLREVAMQNRLTAGQITEDVEQVVISADNLSSHLTEWGPVVEAVFTSLRAKGTQDFEVLQQKFPDTVTDADSLRDYLESTFGPNVAEEFEKLADSAEENFDAIKGAFASLLPSMDETFTAWRERVEQAARDQAAFKDNVTTIYLAIRDAGVAMPAEITAAIADMGPGYVAQFTKFFQTDPQAAIDTLALFAPAAMGTTVDAVIGEIEGRAPGMDLALQTGIVEPWERSTAEADRVARENAAAAVDGMKESIDQGLEDMASIMEDSWTTPIRDATGSESLRSGVFSDGQAVGTDAAAGVAAGLNAGQNAIDVALSTIAARIPSVVARLLGIASPSKVMEEEVGLPISQGIAAGVAAGGPEVEAAVTDVIGNALSSSVALIAGMRAETGNQVTGWLQAEAEEQFRDQFGDIGLQFVEAIGSQSEAAGERLRKMVDDAIEEAREAGVPNAEELGKNLIDAIAAGLDGNDAGMQAALAAIAAMNAAMAEAAEEGPYDFVSGFDKAFNDAWARANLEDNIGSKGVQLIDALTDAIENQTPGATEKAASLAADIVDALSDNLDPEEGSALITAFMDAVNSAIQGGGEAALLALQTVLAQIHEAGGLTGSSGSKPKKSDPADPDKDRVDVYSGPTGRYVEIHGKLYEYMAQGRYATPLDPATGKLLTNWRVPTASLNLDLDSLGGGQTFGSTPQFRAKGGPVMPGQAYWVGEIGPELFVPKTAGDIIPAHRAMGAVTQNNVFNITGNNPQEIAAEVERVIEKQLTVDAVRWGVAP